jgi:hypothetical protein
MISSAWQQEINRCGSPCCINTVDRTNGRYPLSEQDRGRPVAAAHIQDTIAGLELKIISRESAEGFRI